MANWKARDPLKMKIAYISTAEVPSTRANSLQVMKVCQALVQLGEDVRLYLPGEGVEDWAVLTDTYGLVERFSIERFPARAIFNKLDFAYKTVARALQEKNDLVYTRMPWAALIARARGLKSVLEMHDLPTGRFGPLVYCLYLRQRNPGLTVYITAALKELVDKSSGVQARPAEYAIAPDGVDLARYDQLPGARKARAELGLPEHFTAVYSGGFYPGRGLEVLEPLAQAFPQVQFLWVGGSAEQVAHWQSRLDTNAVKNVTLTGFIANHRLPLYQAAADVLLMPYSRSFGGSGGGNIARVSSPLKLFEYLASGRAILASDLPVLREVLNEKTACLYAPEDFADLCRKFAQLVSDHGWRKRLGEAARLSAQAYDWKTRMAGILGKVNSLPN
jgi:glycosyltransferase involved in cell wall biosynthesis